MLTNSPELRHQRTDHQMLPIHTTTNSTDTTAPPHFTDFLILGCGRMA